MNKISIKVGEGAENFVKSGPNIYYGDFDFSLNGKNIKCVVAVCGERLHELFPKISSWNMNQPEDVSLVRSALLEHLTESPIKKFLPDGELLGNILFMMEYSGGHVRFAPGETESFLKKKYVSFLSN